MEKIAIYGHSTRSKDVIKTLESLGGKNRSDHEGWNESNGYYVDENNYICCDAPRNIPKDYKLYTLEEYEQQITRKQITIQGHPTRNNDLIKILESLGGINGKDYLGNDTHFYYYINTKNFIDCEPDGHLPQGYKKYNLEEYEQTCNTMKNIAILGHRTRSKDIIKILESLGGVNTQNYECNSTRLYYYVNDANYIESHSWACLDKKYKTYTLEEYEQKLLNTMETKRNIQIDLNTAKEWYKQGGDLRKVALQAFTENELNSFPKSWEEYCKINPYLIKGTDIFLHSTGLVEVSYSSLKREDYPGVMPSKERAEQFLILNKLLQIHDYYNQGWKPNWKDDTDKYVIWSFENELHLDVSTYASSLFAFKSKEVRDIFFENFENDLEKVKKFL